MYFILLKFFVSLPHNVLTSQSWNCDEAYVWYISGRLAVASFLRSTNGCTLMPSNAYLKTLKRSLMKVPANRLVVFYSRSHLSSNRFIKLFCLCHTITKSCYCYHNLDFSAFMSVSAICNSFYIIIVMSKHNFNHLTAAIRGYGYIFFVKLYRYPATRLEHYLKNDTVSRRPG